MPSQAQLQATILTAQLKLANIVLTNVNAEKGGNTAVNWWPAQRFSLNIKALLRQYTLGDYTSASLQAVYRCVTTLIGFDATLNQIDPNYQSSGNTIIIETTGNFTQSDRIPFGPVNSLVIDNWVTNYYPIYGDNPEVQIFIGNATDGYQQDEQTTPVPAFPGNDITQRLQSLTWTWGVATSGYYIISGKKPSS
jgi:hypothetical protein